MAFDYNSIIPLISSIALLISILSAYYTYYQNQRKMEVDLWIHKHDGTSMVTFMWI
ncbi:putative membrane protein [Methanobacterium formicicum]|uniref:Putative membrane protein n=1 Tax=Methanobacterium formicicum TaxID=2162 RepID=A0A090I275_METFO|nr:putative membrane protein [Methanobacterium formicicum]